MWIQRFGQISTKYMLKMGLFCIYRKWYSAVHGAIVRSMIFFTHVCYIFSLFLRNIFLVSPVTAQYTISMKETMLKPRQSPNRPPSEAMKSTGPILMLLSNSEKAIGNECPLEKMIPHPWLSPCQKRHWQQRCPRPRRYKLRPWKKIFQGFFIERHWKK